MEVDVYTPMAVCAVVATILILVTSLGIFSEKPIYMNLVVVVYLGLALLAYVNLIDKTLFDLPKILIEILAKDERPALITFWAVNVTFSILFVIYISARGSANTVHRKFFHLTVSLIFISGIVHDAVFLWLCSWLILALFVIVELFRFYEVPPWGNLLSNMMVFHDRQDGNVLLTQILLHLGIFFPIMLPGAMNWRTRKVHLHHFAGVAAVGVGDSFAAIVGSKLGTKYWPGMQKIKDVYNSTHAAVRRTVEWRSPLTGLYLMIVNSTFWLGVIYGDKTFHQTALVTAIAVIFAWDVLLSPSHEHNIITHIFLWPFQSVWRTAAVAKTVYGLVLLKNDETEHVCWITYAALTCLLINPVWEHQKVSQKIRNTICAMGTKIWQCFQFLIVTPIMKVYAAVKYVVLLQFIPPLWTSLKHFIFNFRASCAEIYRSIIAFFRRCIDGTKEFIKKCYVATKKFLRYWFLAEWWPTFKAWLAVKVGRPLREWADCICFCVVYVVCGHWVPPVWRFFSAQVVKLAILAHKYVLEPSKRYISHQFDRFRIWLRAKLHRLAVAIRDSILWPICVLVVEVAEALCGVIYRILVEPVLVYLYQRYRIIETVILIYFLGPALDVVINNIPEKNPLVDESDVEFDGFLPEEVQDGDGPETDSDEENDDVVPASKDSEDEIEFSSGLKFRDVNDSESSDEEFDLKMKKRQKKKKQYTSNDNLESSPAPSHSMSTSSTF